MAVKDKNRVRNTEIELLNAVRNPIQEVGLSSDIRFINLKLKIFKMAIYAVSLSLSAL